MTKFLLISMIFLSSAAYAQNISRIISPDLGSVVDVTPGQQFYADTYIKPIDGFVIEKPFKSSMAGSMGFSFSFSIDSTLLKSSGKTIDGRWTRYVPDSFSASHGLLGNVLSPGDTVGLMVSEIGEMKWFVDNSIHNSMTTIWTRKLKKSDQQPRKISTQKSETVGLPLFRLIYLGQDSGKVKIRFEQREQDGSYLRDEFLFPIRPNGTAVGAVRGAEFVVKVGDLRSQVVVFKAMTGEFGLAAPPITEKAVPEEFKI